MELFGITLPFGPEGLLFLALAIGMAIGSAAGGWLLRRNK